MNEDLADFVIDQDGFRQGYGAVKTLASLLDEENEADIPEQPEQYTRIVIRSKYTI